MDKDTTRNLLIATGVFLVLVWLGPMLAPPAPPRPAPTPDGPMAPGSPAAPAVQEAAPSAPGAVGATGETVPSAAPSGALQVLEADSEVTLTLGAEPFDAQASRKEAARHARAEPFRMHLTLSNVGAAVESATMTDHAEELKGSARYRLLAPVERGDGTPLRSLAVERINVDGVDVLLHDKKWHAQPVRPCTFADGGAGVEAVFHLDIQREGVPALQVTRTWRLPRQAWELERHDLHSDIQVRNLDSQAHRVVVSYYGGLGVRQARPSSMDDRFIDLGVRAASGLVAGQRRTLHEITAAAGKDVPLYVSSAQDAAARLIWAATGNTYFTCTVAPLTPDAQDGPAYVTEVSAFDADGAAATTHDAAVRFVTKAEPLGAGQAVSYPAEVFLGEKEINGFRDVPAYKARNYYYQISQGYGSCTFSWLVEMMIWLLNSLFFMVRDFGWAIIVLVLIVRAMLHPITKKGQINMVRMQHRMQELAPKIEEIKKKFGNDKARMNQEMMKLNINPAGQLLTCLPMFIQMPIWVALWLSLNNNVLMRH
ncbi:MAG: YidC/Oxa1 family insertase periplasmic-domain containing protein [Planctomycetes bacterium]|nr:YidC/Oxa1 family insertase periplasmic-domain containing protein [Planctomycetota bacterium]